MIAAKPVAENWPSPLRAWITVAVLMGAYTCAFIDRQVLALLVEPIRRDLDISDTQFSLLSGGAFMIFYIGLVMPLAWVADRGNRRTLIIVGVSFWTMMTAVCGMASSYWSLFVARMGVGAGEAALSPAAYSIIADSFPIAKRARAMTIYSTGSLAGSGLALVIGGTVIHWADQAGPIVLPIIGGIAAWQLAFFLVSIPGLLVLLFLLTCVREPIRQEAAGGDAVRVSMKDLLHNRTAAFLLVTFGYSMNGIVIASYMAWTPTVLIRTYGWTASEAGHSFGIILLLASTSGAVLGGIFADKLLLRGYSDAMLRMSLLTALIGLPFAVATPLAPSSTIAIVLLTATQLAMGMANGLAAPTFQAMVNNRLRARIFALYFIIANPIAFVVGPTAVALISDRLLHDPHRIGLALSVLCGAALVVGAILMSLGLAPYRRSVEMTRLAAAEGAE